MVDGWCFSLIKMEDGGKNHKMETNTDKNKVINLI